MCPWQQIKCRQIETSQTIQSFQLQWPAMELQPICQAAKPLESSECSKLSSYLPYYCVITSSLCTSAFCQKHVANSHVNILCSLDEKGPKSMNVVCVFTLCSSTLCLTVHASQRSSNITVGFNAVQLVCLHPRTLSRVFHCPRCPAVCAIFVCLQRTVQTRKTAQF